MQSADETKAGPDDAKPTTPVSACDVLVVGAGLGGLALALALARDQVRVALVDKTTGEAARSVATVRAGGSLLTPACVLWARKLGIYKKLREDPDCEAVADFEGLSNPALITNGKVARGGGRQEGEEADRLRRDLAGKKNYGDRDCCYLSIEQKRVEDALYERVRESDFVNILWGQEFKSMEAGETEVLATLHAVSSDFVQSVRCKYVVGCDGRASGVRRAHFHRDNIEGFEYREHKGVMLHMMCECRLEWNLDRKSYRLEQKSLNGFGPTIGGGAAAPVPSSDASLYRVSVNAPFTMWGSSIEGMDHPPLSLVQKQLKPKLPRGAKLSDPLWTRYYRMNHFVSFTFGHHRAFLVGEAAHAHPPVGILPMNAVIEDADNLAWKLALAVKTGGGDKADLLETYDGERRPMAEGVRKSIAGYFSDLMQGNLRPVNYARNDCGLFSALPASSALVVEPPFPERYAAKAGELAPSVKNLLLTNTMKQTRLEDILLSSTKHKIFCFCSDWPVKMDSPYTESEPSHSGKNLGAPSTDLVQRCGSPQPHTWEKMLQNMETILGPEMVKLCEFYTIHSTTKIAHMDGLDYNISHNPTHVVDAEEEFAASFGNLEGSTNVSAVLIRPDLRIGCIGEFPHFIQDLKEYCQAL